MGHMRILRRLNFRLDITQLPPHNIGVELTVITSVFNSEKFLEHFFQDIKRQTVFDDCQFLMLDANSTDNSRQMILEQCIQHKNIQYCPAKNFNIYQTWNLGVYLAEADFVTNWNTDDRRLPDSLEKQVRTLQDDPQIDLCYGRTLWVDTPNVNVEDCDPKNETPCFPATIESMLKFNSPHCLPVWRKNMHERFGWFNESYFSAGDYEMWMRALSGGSQFAMLDELVGAYYRNPKGISSNPENLDRAVEEVMKIRRIYA